jgi:glutamine amidotransferase
VKVVNPDDSLLKTDYGVTFDSAVNHENIFGAQFHPEKSLKFGMHFLKNFASV